MNCPNCGTSLPEGSAFCNSCGAPVAAADAVPVPPAAPVPPVEADPVEPQAAPVPPVAAAPVPPAGTNPAEPQAAPADFGAAQPYAQPNVAAGAVPGAVPGQQPYGAQPGYQQPVQPAPPVPQKVYAQTTPNSRALAMSAYWGLLPLIFAFVVGDKDEPFLKHHLNQALVIVIGSLIGGVLSVILVGFILLIFLFVMEIMGTIQAYHSEMTELPLIGKIKIIK